MLTVQLSTIALEDLLQFKMGNQKLAFKVLELIVEIQRHPFEGLGKPEPLKGNYQGCWSRRINDEHRLIYEIKNNIVVVHSCRGHYLNK